MNRAAAPAVVAPVPSPCNGVCRIHPGTGWCEGCRRSLDEIAGWSAMGEAQRREVLALLPSRQAQAGNAAG